MTAETLAFLRDILTRQTLAVGAPDFPDTARLVMAALAELDTAIAAQRQELERRDA